MRRKQTSRLAALALVLAALACNADAPCDGDRCEKAAEPGFETDLSGDGNADAVDPPAPASSASADSADFGRLSAMQRAIEATLAASMRAVVEADIIQVNGDRLYALSQVAGLAVIDVSDPSALQLLGRFRELPATPFEMYLRDGVALVTFRDWGQYVEAEDGTGRWVSTSKVLALDVSDPASIRQLGSFDVPGTISDTRMVGDILYVVAHQGDSCWRCVSSTQGTSIVSLSVADPQNVRQLDTLFYDEETAAWGPRSVTVTAERMYVAGPEYGREQWTGSTIQVVDISDPSGDLVEGASVKVEGQINSRWQMDEYQGVLRVVSQPPSERTQDGLQTGKPAIETFKVESSQKLSQLGRADFRIPERDRLRSVRFDHDRGYAITAEQTDPLYTLDLSDPSKPRVAGELKVPGFVYHMEPRGNRVLGLGFDQNNPEGAITVSLFDVSDMTKPSELSRVNFGGSSGRLPEGQDRIHKVFRVLDDEGLLLVPFSGGSRPKTDGIDCYDSRPVDGGVQLIDFSSDTLHRRGTVPTRDETRRALMVHDTLLSVSDSRVQSFDISERDMPEALSQVALMRRTKRAIQLGDSLVARLGYGYFSNDLTLDLVSRDRVDEPNESFGELNLTELTASQAGECPGGISVEETFARGSTLEVLYKRNAYDRTQTNAANRRGLLVIDASDPHKPSVTTNLEWDVESWSAHSIYPDYTYYARAMSAVRTDSALALLESMPDNASTGAKQRVRLRVLDLRDLGHVTNTVVPLEAFPQYSGLQADGDVVMLSHLEASAADARRGRFYIDRVDLADPSEPRQLAKVNVPGSLVTFDPASRRAVTREQERTVVVTWISREDCDKRFASSEWFAASAGSTPSAQTAPSADSGAGSAASDMPMPPLGQCTGFPQRLNVVQLSGDTASLDGTLRLPDNRQLFAVSQGDGVVFATLGNRREGAAPADLLVFGDDEAGELQHGMLGLQWPAQSRSLGYWPAPLVFAYGKRAMLTAGSEVVLVDASEPSDPALLRRMAWSSATEYAEVHGDSALLTLGGRDAQWIELRD